VAWSTADMRSLVLLSVILLSFNDIKQVTHTHRAGVRHVRGVRLNTAADFKGPPILAFFI